MKKPPSGPLGDRLDLRYVTARRNASGQLRRYWQRKGHKLVRLPEGPEWAAAATHLNRAAEPNLGKQVVEGSVAWAIQRYRASSLYADKTKSTKNVYEKWLREFEALWGALPCAGITRRVVIKYIESIKSGGRPTRLHAAAVLRNVIGVAHDAGVVSENPVTNLRIGRNKPRQAIWTAEDMAAFENGASAQTFGAEAILFMWLLLYTGQRPIDVCAMQVSHYDGDTIKVRQQKTGTLVAVPCHAELRPKLEAGKRTSLFLLSRPDGRKFHRHTIGEICLEIRRAAQIEHLQMRDIRRTAVVRLAEAGCTTPEISAISGHSIERTERILEVYLPRTLPMGRAAILKWENKPGEFSNALEKPKT